MDGGPPLPRTLFQSNSWTQGSSKSIFTAENVIALGVGREKALGQSSMTD